MVYPPVPPAGPEEILHQDPTFFFHDSGYDLNLMVKAAVGSQIKQRPCRATLGIRGAENQSFDPRVEGGAHAHDARFSGDNENSIVQPVVLIKSPCHPHGKDFSMTSRVTESYGLIMGPGNNLALHGSQNRAHRDFPLT